MSIKLAARAQQDLDDIRRYTIEVWGREQWLKYYRGLVTIFEIISKDAKVGRDRRLFMAGMRSLNFQRHVIFFKSLEAAGGAPVILRIVHERRYMPALVYSEGLGRVALSLL